MKRLSVAGLALMALLGATRLDAQPANSPGQPGSTPTLPDRVFVDVNAGYQSGTEQFSDERTDSSFAESATWKADYETRSGPVFDGGVGVRLWRNLIVAGAYSRYDDTNFAAVQGGVPHPFFFNRTRRYTGEADGLTQQEDVVHISAMWGFPITRHLDARLSGGPSAYRVRRDLIEDVSYDDEYPYDTVSFDDADVVQQSVTAWGFHVGGDVTWMFTKSIGVGGMVRFSRAEADVASPANDKSIALRFGGLQFGGGLRLRFGGGGIAGRP